ncbi:MAG: 4Fe-4S dicluster domain-containing protein [Spirochaetes bacterium]|nr:4Fe-4S dicluster domain-containing protein [Spirochaetota bacterium]
MLSSFDILLTVIALFIMLAGIFRHRSVWKAGREESRSGSWAGLIKYIFEHGKILKKRGRGIAHFFVFYGFFLPLVVIILAQFNFEIGIIPSGIVSLLLDIIGTLFLTGIVILLIRRIVSQDSEGPLRTIFPMIILCVIIITGFLAEGARLGISGTETVWASPVGWIFSVFVPASPSFMQIIIRVHFYAVLLFLALLPFNFAKHIIASSLNVYFKRKNPRGELNKAYLTDDSAGAAIVRDFTWKQLLDAEACVSCGRCEENCPAFISGKPLSPRKIIRDIYNLMYLSNGEKISSNMLESTISNDEIWSCTACMACVEHCPVYAEPMDKIIDMRRHQVMCKGQLPAEAVPMIRNLEIFGDVQGKGAAHRMDWAMSPDLEFANAENADADILLWPGCSGAFHPRYQEVLKAMVKILNTARIRFSTLGKDELCCGDPARRLGNESLFLELAGKNISSFRKNNIKKILTLCPHCFNTLKNEYPGVEKELFNKSKENIEVVHASEYIMELIKVKRIVPKYPLKKNIAFQDPCYLGRVNGIYNEPREVISSIPGTALKELDHNRETGFCCGGGGGGMWMHEHSGKRMNVIRAEEVAEADPEVLCTACPYCLTMLEDGLSSLESEKETKVLDIVEIIAGAI